MNTELYDLKAADGRDFGQIELFTLEPQEPEVCIEVRIPTLDGTRFAEAVRVKVPAWRDPEDGEFYLDSAATKILEKVKARHTGLLTPSQIKVLRKNLGLTQKEISNLLQIGLKTWTRWETGRERPFRSINVLLCALHDGKIDLPYLASLAQRRNDRQPAAETPEANPPAEEAGAAQKR